jgi:hypothetical protein
MSLLRSEVSDYNNIIDKYICCLKESLDKIKENLDQTKKHLIDAEKQMKKELFLLLKRKYGDRDVLCQEKKESIQENETYPTHNDRDLIISIMQLLIEKLHI